MLNSNDNLSNPNKNDEKASIENLAAKTMPVGFSDLLNNIDKSLANARKTIDDSLFQSSKLLKQSLASLSKPSLLHESMPQGVNANNQNVVSGSHESEEVNENEKESELANEAVQEPINDYVQIQQSIEDGMVAALEKSKQAVEEGLKAQHMAQMELQKTYESQHQETSMNGSSN